MQGAFHCLSMWSDVLSGRHTQFGAMTAPEPSHPRGAVVEEHARQIAGLLGVPDFVYEPVLEPKGTGQREVSDGMIICGDDGLIMQVKSRDSSAADTPERAEQWIRKHAQTARTQADGTRRRLAQRREITFTSLRGYERILGGSCGWPAVVIIDHDAIPPGLQLLRSTNTLWITLADWRELHAHLRSAAAVISYVSRALECGLQPALGDEVSRYRALAQADAAAPGGPASVPMLPLRVLEGPEARHAEVIEGLIEKVWPQDGPISWLEPDEYRAIVERLDRIPPAQRAKLGAKLIATLADAVAAGARRSFLLYDTSQDARLAFVCDILRDAEREEQLMAEIALLASVRQHQALEGGAGESSVTLGVGILHGGRRGLQYSFALVGTPPVEIDVELRRQIEGDYGPLDARAIRPMAEARP